MLAPWKKSCDEPRWHIKKQRHYFANKGLWSQDYGSFTSHVWMWDLDHKEGWAPKTGRFWTVMLEKTLESPLDCREIKPVSLQEINVEYSLEGLMVKVKLQYFGHLMGRADSWEYTLMLENIEGGRRRRWQRMRWLELWRKLSTEELMLLNCGVGEDSCESLGLARRSSQSTLKEISPECSLEGLMLKLKL